MKTGFLTHDLPNEKVINSLPGIFYIYEPIEYYFRLIAWNKNLETVLSYTANELLYKPAHDFFSTTEYKRVAKAMEKVFLRGMKWTPKTGPAYKVEIKPL